MFERIGTLLFGKKNEDDAPRRLRLEVESHPALIYAIGDVHGCLAELRALEDVIFKDAKKVSGQKWIVMLGDYVDRGSHSAQVIDHMLAPVPQGFERICLAGNHEQAMMRFLEAPKASDRWLGFGGVETLLSYGISTDVLHRHSHKSRHFKQALDSYIPQEHIDFLHELPICLKTPALFFTHAGVRPNVPLDEQKDRDLMWIRDEFLTAPEHGERIIVHGHTPVDMPVYEDGRVNVDTGAFGTGRLSAARIVPGGEISFLSNIF